MLLSLYLKEKHSQETHKNVKSKMNNYHSSTIYNSQATEATYMPFLYRFKAGYGKTKDSEKNL